MPHGMYRIGIVGASSLVGKELADELSESLLATSDFVLLEDEDEAAGVIAAAGDEPSVIRPIEPGTFAGMDFVFFCGTPEAAVEHYQAARSAGASIIDLGHALEGELDVLIRSPWVSEMLSTLSAEGEGIKPNLKTQAVVSAHPAAVMLGLIAGQLALKFKLESVAATILEPASQHGREAMDELHQQTVNLLSFQDLPKDQYDAQVSFNLLPALGEGAKVNLGDTQHVIQKHYEILSAGRLPELALQLVQAPVFHGYTASMLIDLKEATTVDEVEKALAGDLIDVVTNDSEPPSNLTVAGQENIMVRVRSVGEGKRATRYWLWVGADNLKVAALNGIACANELRRMRPHGSVQ